MNRRARMRRIAIDDRRGPRVEDGVPFAAHGVEEAPAHEIKPLQKSRNFWIEREERRDVRERPDGEQRHFAGIRADRAAHEVNGRVVGDVAVARPVAEFRGLRTRRLALGNGKRHGASRVDRNVSATVVPADGGGHFAAPFRFAADRRDAEKFALRLAQQVGERERIVDVVADVGVE